MEGRLFEGSAFKNQEFSHQFQNLMHHESNDGCLFCGTSSSHESSFLPIHQRRVGLGVSPTFYNPNPSFSGFNYSVAPNAGSNTLRFNERYNSRYFQQSSNNDQGGSSLLVSSDGKNMRSLVHVKQTSGENVFPKQISSARVCSRAEWCFDKECFEVGTTFFVSAFSEPASGNSGWVKHNELLEETPNFNHAGAHSLLMDKYNAWLQESISLGIPEDTNAPSSMSKPKSSHGQLSQNGLQALQSKRWHLQPCPILARLGISLEAQVNWCSVGHKEFHNKVPGERSSKISQLSSEQLHRSQAQGFRNVQTSNSSLQNILVSYLNYKSKLVHASRRQQEFVGHLHLTACKDLCQCEKYRTLISHFDNCRKTDCTPCGPVRDLCHTKRINSGTFSKLCPSKKITSNAKRHRSDLHPSDCIIQDIQPTPKYMRMEAAVEHDNWSLAALVQ